MPVNLLKVRQIRVLTENTFVLRFDRGNIEFAAGQYLTVGTKGSLNHREYSVYSSEDDDYLEILVREVLDGNVSRQLRQCTPGSLLEVNGPFGSFRPGAEKLLTGNFVFIASGTGIAPFHSIVTSCPGINYTILHGVRFQNEAYEKDDYNPQRYILCTSKGYNGNYTGRVTDCLRNFPVRLDMQFYLCGSSNMIYDVINILRAKGVSAENIFSEVYF